MAGETPITVVGPRRSTHLTDPLHIARFWSKVNVGRPGVCWPWKAAANEHGYGIFMLPDRAGTAKAHRIAWSVTNGRALMSSEALLHSCDNPPCCNPAHLSIGTQQENIADMVAKGRQRGIRHSRLEPAQVDEIKARCASGEHQSSIAVDFNISPAYVSLINTGARLSRKESA